MTDHDDMPEWAAPLFAGPITFSDETSADDLADEFERRLAALLRLYGCKPTADGWRRLALRLALGHAIGGAPVMGIETPDSRVPGAPGRPADYRQGLWVQAIEQAIRANPALTVKAAAEKVKKKHPDAPSVGRLRNLVSDMRRQPRELIPGLFAEMRAEDALAAAAARLEDRSRK